MEAKRKKRPVNITVPPDLLESADAIMRREGISRSYFFVQALRAYTELAERCARYGVKRLPTLEFRCPAEGGAGGYPTQPPPDDCTSSSLTGGHVAAKAAHRARARA